MRKILNFLFLSTVLLLSSFSFLSPFAKPAYASFEGKAGTWPCKLRIIDESGKTITTPSTGNRAIKFEIDTGHDALPNTTGQFLVVIKDTGSFFNTPSVIQASTTITDSNGVISTGYFDRNGQPVDPKNNYASITTWPADDYRVNVYDATTLGNILNVDFLNPGSYGNAFNLDDGFCLDASNNNAAHLGFRVSPSGETGSILCTFKFGTPLLPDGTRDPKYLTPGNDVNFSVNVCPETNVNNPMCAKDPNDANYGVRIDDSSGNNLRSYGGYTASAAGTPNLLAGGDAGAFNGGNYLLRITYYNPVTINGVLVPQQFECSKKFKIDANGGVVGCNPNAYDTDCKDDPNGSFCMPDPSTGLFSCQNGNNGLATNPCVDQSNNNFICQTAIGAIGTSAGDFAKGVLQLFFALAGIILLFIIILNGYRFITSQGDPEKVKEARESITSAIAGLIVVALAIVILQFITVTVLGLPGFN